MDFQQYLDAIEKPKKSVFSKNYSPEQLSSIHKMWIDGMRKQIPNYQESHQEETLELVKYIMRIGSKMSLNKGVLLIGATGTGKTRIMNNISMLIGFLHRFRFKIYSGNEMEKCFRQNEGSPGRSILETAIKQKMFGIDDLGEEHNSVKVFGTEINVGVEVLSTRYNEYIKNGSLTFCTTNLNRNDLLNKYGRRIDSRIDEMFNVIYINGTDFRKKS